MQCVKQLVRFRHLERRMIRQHHAACAEPNPRSHRANMRDQNLRGRRHDTRQVVVLRVPKPRVAKPIECTRKFAGPAKRLSTRASFAERNQIECRECGSHAIFPSLGNGKQNVIPIARLRTIKEFPNPNKPEPNISRFQAIPQSVPDFHLLCG